MRNNRIVFGIMAYILLLGLIVFVDTALAGAPAFKPGQQLVVANGETPAYPSLEAAKKGGATEDSLRAPEIIESRAVSNTAYAVLEQQGDWLRVKDVDVADDGENYWVASKAMRPLDDFLSDPANKEIVLACPDALPKRIVLDLDEGHKQAVLRLITKPSLEGGDIRVEVWDSAEKTLLWSTDDPENSAERAVETGEFSVQFGCYPLATLWPQVTGDLNGDGKGDILYMESEAYRNPPPSLTLLTWNGKRFVLKQAFTLAAFAADMPKSGPLDAEGPENAKSRIYLESLLGLGKDGNIRATFIQDSPADETAPFKRGVGLFLLNKDGKTFVFDGWESPLKAAE